MDRPFVAENDAERARLRALVERLTDEDLRRPMPAGWTVSAVLAHMAFWDARAVVLTDKWARGVAPSGEDWEPPHIDWINDAGKLLMLEMPPRTAARLALEMAERADRGVEAMPEETLAQVLAIGQPFNLSRASHRREHLDDIERVL